MKPIPGEDIDLPLAKVETKKPEDLDHTPFKSGKYQGHTPSRVAEWNPAYIVALYENVTPKRVSQALYRDCRDEMLDRINNRYEGVRDISEFRDFDELDFY